MKRRERNVSDRWNLLGEGIQTALAERMLGVDAKGDVGRGAVLWKAQERSSVEVDGDLKRELEVEAEPH